MYNENYNVEIEPANGHWEAYVDGEFYCSADTYSEAEREVYSD